jgi:hypothetical protein
MLKATNKDKKLDFFNDFARELNSDHEKMLARELALYAMLFSFGKATQTIDAKK